MVMAVPGIYARVMSSYELVSKMDHYQKMAEGGDRVAQFELAQLLKRYEGKYTAGGYKWYLKSAEGGYTPAQYRVGLILTSVFKHTDDLPKDDERAVFWLSEAGNQDYGDAMMILAKHYRLGAGVEQDFVKERHYILAAAKLGVLSAQRQVAEAYHTGNDGWPVNQIKAKYWSCKAFEGGYNETKQICLKLREQFKEWEDVESELQIQYEKARQGLPASQYEYSRILQLSRGEIDSEIELWMKKAADNGVVEAATRLGLYYSSVTGTTKIGKDDEEAVHYLIRAVESGNAYATKVLAEHYRQGLGVTKDVSHYVDLYILAADRGDRSAIMEVSGWYNTGAFGLNKNLNYSGELLCKAFEMGELGAEAGCHVHRNRITLLKKRMKRHGTGSNLTIPNAGSLDDYVVYNVLLKQWAGISDIEAMSVLASAGDIQAKATLGVVLSSLSEFHSALKNDKRAIPLLQDAVAEGRQDAMEILAKYYDVGVILEKDISETKRLMDMSQAKGVDVTK